MAVAPLVMLSLSGCGVNDSNESSASTPAASVGAIAGTTATGPNAPEDAGREPRPSGGGSDGDSTGPASTAHARPAWLGTRVLPRASDGFGERRPTPPELVDRRLEPPPPVSSTLPAVAEDGSFRATIEAVPADVARRSTWSPACPVSLEELRYVTATFVGFDGRAHMGELLVHVAVAEDVVGVLAKLHAVRFPLEELRVIDASELDLPPTGDGNVTSAFVCRPTVGGTRWSEHAFGRAIDINPFHNPYVRGDLVIPELAGAYVDRSDLRPGMVVAEDAVTEAFAAIGWGWGGDWTGSATDPMHFSASGR